MPPKLTLEEQETHCNMNARNDRRHGAPDAELAVFRQWMMGFNAYCDGLPLAACQNDQQRRGYVSASKAEAQFQVARLHDQGPSIEDDARFIAYEF